MTALDEKPRAMPVSVLTLPRPTKAYQHPNKCIDVLSTVDDLESTRSLSPATTVDPDAGGKYAGDVNPLSPFYNPSPTRLSLDAQKSESRRDVHLIPAYDTDLEAGSTPPASAISSDKSIAKPDTNFHCAVWPNQQAMRMKKKAMRRTNGRYMMCGWLAARSKPTRITIKTIFALVLIGAAVGIAIGISKAVGGGVWRNSQNTNAPIGGTHR